MSIRPTAGQVKHLFEFARSADDNGVFTVPASAMGNTGNAGNKRMRTLLQKLDEAGAIAVDGFVEVVDTGTYHLTDRGLELLGKPSHIVKSRALSWQYFTYKAFGRDGGHWLAQKGNHSYRIESPAQPQDTGAARWLREWRVQRFDTLPPKKGAWCPAPTLAAAKRVCLRHASTGQWIEPGPDDTGEDALEPDKHLVDEAAEAYHLLPHSDLAWTPSETNRDKAMFIATVEEGWYATYCHHCHGLDTARPEWYAVSFVPLSKTAPERSACLTAWSSLEDATAACVYHRAHKKWPRRKLGPDDWLERNWRQRYDH